MAEVYLAQQQGLAGFEKLVVVKRVLPHLREDSEFIHMLLAEARLAAGLRHPNIVEVYDVRRDEQEFFIVMEYLGGEDLRFILTTARKEGFQLPVGVVGRIISDAAAGLDFAHRAADTDGRPFGVVHRDIGPTNIILTYHGVSKVLDFGVAKANIHNIYTRPGTLKGKYGYSSPEQVRHRTLDARSDIFSLGIVLHELLTGRRLFRGRTPPEVLKAVMEAPIPAPSHYNPEVPPDLDALVAKALARNRAERLRSAAELQDGLEHILERQGLMLSSHQVATWMSTVLSEAKDRRAELEATVAHDAEAGAALSTPVAPPAARPSANPGPTASQSQHHSQSHASTSWPGSAPSQAAWQQSSLHPPPSSTRRRAAVVVLLASLSTLLVVALIGVAFWLGRQGTRPEVVEVATPSSVAAAPTQVALHVHVVPAGAQLQVDGRPWPHPIGSEGVLVPRAAGQETRLLVDKAGYTPQRRTEAAPPSGTRNTYFTLVRDAAIIEPTEAPTPARAAASTSEPAAQRASATAPTRRRSTETRRRRAQRPSSPRAASASTGRLSLRVDPATAEVLVDGVAITGGASREVPDLRTGEHQLRVLAPGFAPEERTLSIRAGEPLSLQVSLRRAEAEAGTLDIVSQPVGAEVRVGGELRGKSPVLGLRVPAGREHRIELRLEGYATWSATVNPVAGPNPRVSATLVPNPAAEAAPAPSSPATRSRGLKVPADQVGAARAGLGLFRDKCNRCHGRDAKVVRPSLYTRAQWSRYFARARHRRHASLAEDFSRPQLADVKAYLMSAAADVESDTAAGVR